MQEIKLTAHIISWGSGERDRNRIPAVNPKKTPPCFSQLIKPPAKISSPLF